MTLLSRFFRWFRPAQIVPPVPLSVLTPPTATAPAPAPAPTPAPPPSPPPQPIPVPQYRGTNLTGGDSYYAQWGSAGPVSGTNYLFVSDADIDKAIAKGMTTFRIVFGWEAMQPKPYATLAGAYFDNFMSRVKYILSKGCTPLLDIHGGADATFAAYYGVPVGAVYTAPTGLTYRVADLLENIWWQLAGIFQNDPRVWFGITNEPHGVVTADVWYPCLQSIINSVRRQGYKGKLVPPGVNWSNASTWVSSGNAKAFEGLVDPLNNIAAQVHLYCDANAGGGATDIVSATIAVDRLKNAVAWARASGHQLFVGEIGISATNTLAPACWKNFVDYVNANRDVILGFCWWALGPPKWWGGYRYALLDTSGNYTPQMSLIEGAFK